VPDAGSTPVVRLGKREKRQITRADEIARTVLVMDRQRLGGKTAQLSYYRTAVQAARFRDIEQSPPRLCSIRKPPVPAAPKPKSI
jgi:hypothetical protein